LLDEGLDNGNQTQYIDTTVAATSSITYYYYLVASNGYGISMPSDTESITTSAYIDNRKWYLNFASSYGWLSFPGSPWNNIKADTTTGLKDSNSQNSSVGLALHTNWWKVETKGAQTGNNSGIYPDNVLRDNYYFGWQGGPAQVNGDVTGLDPTKSYALTFFSSSSWSFTSDNGYTVFQIGDQKDSIYVQANTSRTLTISNITPSSNGTISFTMTKGAKASAGYLNAMIVNTMADIAPAEPINLHSTNIISDGANAIRLNWQPGSNNTDTILIFRSSKKYGPYTLLNSGQTGMDSSNLLDTAVSAFHSETYYYYLVASNAYGHSSSTDTVHATTSDLIPTPPTDLHVSQKVVGNSYVAAINWQLSSDNEKEIDIYRATSKSGPYTLLYTTADTTSASYLDPTVALGTSYYYYLIARNQFGSSNPTDTVSTDIPATPPPMPPVITAIPDVYVAATMVDTIHVSASASGEVTFSLFNAPSFASVQNIANNTANIILTPGSNNVGDFDSVAAIATDSNGNADTAYFSLHITDGNLLSKIFLNFTASGYMYGHAWNNIIYSSSNNTVYGNLINSINQPTNVSITEMTAWSGTQTSGANTYNNTGFVPDSIMGTGYYLSDNTVRQLNITGLDINKKYNLVFFASSNNGGNIDYTTEYSANGTTVSLNGIKNTTDAVRINGITPAQNGSILVSIAKNASASQGLLNAMIIESYDSDAIISPSGLTATANNGIVQLSWMDRSSNEQQFKIMRSNSLNGPYVSVGEVSPNTTAFEDDAVLPDKRYFYMVSAIAPDGTIMPSNVASVTTSLLAVYVNFGLKEAAAPAPWNNTLTPPQSGDIYGPLLDSKGNNTGITLNMDHNFAQENSYGVNTGNNSGVYPDLVMEGTYYADNGLDTVVMRISNLNVTLKYDLTFFGSITGKGWVNTTQYIVNNQMVALEASYNSTQTATLKGISPDMNGEITVKMIYTIESRYVVINAMVLKAYDNYDDDGNKIIDPALLMANKRNTTIGLSKLSEDMEGTASTLTVKTIYPNPFSSLINIELNSANQGEMILSLRDIAGRLINRSKIEVDKGRNTLHFRTKTNLTPGVYLLSLESTGNDKKRINFKVIKR